MKARRIQLRRSAGWRKPAGAVVVSRPSKWGNPYKVGDVVEGGFVSPGEPPRELVLTSRRACELYALWLLAEIVRGRLDLAELRGKDLCCWCPLDKPCHADVLLALANVEPKGAE